MSFDISYRHEEGYVLATIAGAPSLEEFLSALQQIGGDSVRWAATAVIVDLRGVSTPYSFTEQLRIGVAVGRNFSHLRKAAAIAPAERITRVGEKAAIHTGATAKVFATEAEAVEWVLA